MNAFLPETEPNPAESLHFAAVTIRVWGVGKYFPAADRHSEDRFSRFRALRENRGTLLPYR
jgi:hypothetical protein